MVRLTFLFSNFSISNVVIATFYTLFLLYTVVLPQMKMILLFLILLNLSENNPKSKVSLTVKFNVATEKANGNVFFRVKNQKGDIVEQIIHSLEKGNSYELFLPTGAYSIDAFYDENNNGKLDRNYFGIPAEKYGFSNNVRGGITGPPKLSETLFQLDNNGRNIDIELK